MLNVVDSFGRIASPLARIAIHSSDVSNPRCLWNDSAAILLAVRCADIVGVGSGVWRMQKARVHWYVDTFGPLGQGCCFHMTDGRIPLSRMSCRRLRLIAG